MTDQEVIARIFASVDPRDLGILPSHYDMAADFIVALAVEGLMIVPDEGPTSC